MSAVATHRIGDLCEQVRGVTYSKADAVLEAKPGFKPVLRANNITERGLTFDGLVYVPAERISVRQLVRANDVVIAASSGSLDVVGKAARATADFNGGFGAFCKVLRPNGRVDAGYFAHYFQTQDYRRRVSALAAGANINNLRSEHLNDLEIVLPPRTEQSRIAAILDKADALRAKRREAIAKVEQLLQCRFLDMFGDPASNPKGWRTKSLIELSDPNDRINYGVVQPGAEFSGGVPVVRVGDIEGGNLDLSSIKRIDPEIEAAYNRSRLKGNELLVSCVGSIGAVALVPTTAIGFNIARAITRVPLTKVARPPFIRECLRTPALQRYFLEKTRTVSQPTLNVEFVKATKVFDPPAPLVDSYCEFVRQVEKARDRQDASLTGMEAFFASLQKGAFQGRAI